jgi:hypothetical protein
MELRLYFEFGIFSTLLIKMTTNIEKKKIDNDLMWVVETSD